MLYSLPDPTALPTPIEGGGLEMPPPTGEAAAVVQEFEEGAAEPGLRREIAELRGPLLRARDEETAAARETVEASTAYLQVSLSGLGLERDWLDRDRQALSVSRNPELSLEGRERHLRRIEERLKERILAHAEAGPSKGGDALLSQFPEPSFGSPSPALAAEAGLVYESFRYKAASTFLSEAISILRRAIDPAQAPAERRRLSELAYHAYAPLCERRAVSPERFAQPLQTAYRDLAELFRIHLDTTLGAERHRIAAEFVERARPDFTWLVTMGREHHTWDASVFHIGAPSFSWEDDVE